MNTQFPPNLPPGNALSRFVGAVVAVVLMIGLFWLGLVVFAAAAGIALVAFVVFYIRLLWLRRKYGADFGRPGAPGSAARPDRRSDGHVTLEGEFHEKQD